VQRSKFSKLNKAPLIKPGDAVNNTTSDAVAANDTVSVDDGEILLKVKFCFEFRCNTGACYCCEDGWVWKGGRGWRGPMPRLWPVEARQNQATLVFGAMAQLSRPVFRLCLLST
jgi:hypothetical protein